MSLNRVGSNKYGAVIHANHEEQALALLKKVALGESDQNIYKGRLLAAGAPVVFVYTGNGCQWQGMAQQLLREDDEFAAYIRHLDDAFAGLIDFSIVEQLMLPEDEGRLHLTDYAQPLLFSIQVAITQWLRARGFSPDFVLGHSVGEVAAAWAAGSLSLEDAVQVIVHRSAAQALTRGTGRMAAIGLGEDKVNAILKELALEDSIEIACFNAADSLTLAGSLASLERLQDYAEEHEIFFRLLDLDYAFHSRYMDPIEKKLLHALSAIRPSQSDLFVSTASSDSTVPLDAEYWWRNVREPVLFERGIDEVLSRGAQVFVEIGTQPILTRYINTGVSKRGQSAKVFSTLKNNGSDQKDLLQALYASFIAGSNIAFTDAFPNKAKVVPLPAYPWQKERYWSDASGEGRGLVDRSQIHPLLGRRFDPDLPVWESIIDTDTLRFLADHVVSGNVVMPGAGYIEIALAAMKDWFYAHEGGYQAYCDIENIDIVSPMVLDADGQRAIRVELDLHRHKFYIRSKARLSSNDWLLHCVGKLNAHEVKEEAVFSNTPRFSLSPELAAEGVNIDTEAFYTILSQVGLAYGEQFKPIKKLDKYHQFAVAEINLHDEVLSQLNDYILHPVVLDACFQLGAVLVSDINAIDDVGKAYLPVRVERLRVIEQSAIELITAKLVRVSSQSMLVEFHLYNALGDLQAIALGCRFKAMPVEHDPLLQARHVVWSPQLSMHKTRAFKFFSSVEGFIDQYASQLTAIRSKAAYAQYYQDVLPLLETAIAQAFYATVERGFSNAEVALESRALTFDELAFSLHVDQSQLVFFAWILRELQSDGLLKKDHNDLYSLNPDADMRDVSAQAIWNLVLTDYPESLPELVLLEPIICHLPEILSNQHVQSTHALEQRKSALENWYESGVDYRCISEQLSSLVTSLFQRRSEQKNIRVLDFAAHHSHVAELLVPTMLSNDRYDLFASDASIVAKLKDKLHDYLFFNAVQRKTDIFDLNAASIDGEASYDVIVISLAVENADIVKTQLANVLSYLKPDGVLLFLGKAPTRLYSSIMTHQSDRWFGHDINCPIENMLGRSALKSVLFEQCLDFKIFSLESNECHSEGDYFVVAQRSMGRIACS